MNLSLKERIQEDVKGAMRAKDKERLGALRLVTAAIKQREVDERVELDDPGVLAVLEKMLKQRRDSLEQYQAANRQDLAEREAFEIRLIEGYMPTPLSADEVAAAIDEAIAATGASGPKDMGRVMAALKQQVQGRTDMGALSGLVKERLGR